jgi:hypothetical protein
MKGDHMKRSEIRGLEDRIARLEREAGLFEIFSASKRQLRSEEKSLEKQLTKIPGVDNVEVHIEGNDKKHYKGIDIYDMSLIVSYMGEEYDLVGSRVEKVGFGKTSSPMVFFDQARRRQSPRGVPISHVRSELEDREGVEQRVHYKISFPGMKGYSVTIYPVGHRLSSRSDDLRVLFERQDIYRGI